jgi:DNA transposition AAA+ family ATPase
MNMIEFVETENFKAMNELAEKLTEIPKGANAKIGLAYGNFGLGKTFSLERIVYKHKAVLLRARETWSVSTAYGALCDALGLIRVRSSDNMFKLIQTSLLSEPKMIIIDEADKLFGDKFAVLEAFRDIHDEAFTPFLFVGMANFENRLKLREHYHSRVAETVVFKNIPLDDIKKFCELSDVKIENDLVEYFAEKYPNLRKIQVLILRIESFCEQNDMESIDLRGFKMSGVEYGAK